MFFVYSSMFMVASILFFIMSLLFMNLGLVYMFEYDLFVLNSSLVCMTLLLDWISLLFSSFVLFISSMVIMYSGEYMYEDLKITRFVMLVVMFVFSMLLLILSPNLISILLGWDGLGLVSYCLVIYYQNIKSYGAGMLTALSNRIGDVALLMAIAWMLNYGSWNYIFYLDDFNESDSMIIISWLIVLAAFTKSAQIPFSSWLPAAMAAPTPVSSLVHSSTLVTAGVYLLIRFSNCFSEGLMMICLLISVLTMFMSGLGANYEYDLKKIIALSTLSQLGLMMSILMMGDWNLAFFHLLTHALFKALLFMCAGNVIHMMMNYQDIRFLGCLGSGLPLTMIYFNICNLSLCGLPFLSGFYSKDLIVEFMSMNYLNILIYIIFYISIGLTVSYSFRLVYYSFLGNFNFLSLSGMKEEFKYMMKGMSGLIYFVVFMGSVLSWLIFNIPYIIILPKVMKVMTLIMILIGVFVGINSFNINMFKISFFLKYKLISSFLGSMWNMPLIFTLGLNKVPVKMGKSVFKLLDHGWTEFYGARKINYLLIMGGKWFQFLSFNSIKMFFILMVVWLFIIFFI
uniref:NADH-ubiquinone oxidoreductase chain 5 n=1 Tax=Spinolyprops cribricollis TaxID=2984372 RepID=A0A978AYD6_9CUCU|nr:NADH dehydrogenase subunit 5 [Spinolyprops cribricollis]UYB79063.1 NADH dehydrogenase subunit 5 [Spinolyprops cribricollis]